MPFQINLCYLILVSCICWWRRINLRTKNFKWFHYKQSKPQIGLLKVFVNVSQSETQCISTILCREEREDKQREGERGEGRKEKEERQSKGRNGGRRMRREKATTKAK